MLALLQHPCSLEDSLEGEIYSVVCDTCMLHVTCRNLGCFPCMLHVCNMQEFGMFSMHVTVHDNVLVTCDMTKHACYIYMM